MLEASRSQITVVDDELELAQLFVEARTANGYEANLFSDSTLALEEMFPGIMIRLGQLIF
jgi:DNA-binding response OmpR family regulator